MFEREKRRAALGGGAANVAHLDLDDTIETFADLLLLGRPRGGGARRQEEDGDGRPHERSDGGALGRCVENLVSYM